MGTARSIIYALTSVLFAPTFTTALEPNQDRQRLLTRQ